MSNKVFECKFCQNKQEISKEHYQNGFNWKCEKCYEINPFGEIGIIWNTSKPTPSKKVKK